MKWLWRLRDGWWYVGIGLLIGVYTLVTLLAPIDQAATQYHLAPLAVRLLELTLVVPVAAVWLGAVYGSLQFKSYAARIETAPDGRALGLIARGLLILVAGLSVTTVLQASTPLLQSTAWVPAWTVVGNILEAIWPLVAFWVIYRGSQQLMQLVKAPLPLWRGWIMVGLAPLVAGYAWLLLHHPYRASSPDPSIAAYYLPDILLLLLLVLPYALTWYVGLVAAVQIRHYRLHTPGIIYRQALTSLTVGLAAVIGSSLLIQFVTAIGPALQSMGLGAILGLLYLLVAMYASGHVLIVIGARRLAQIEQAV